MIEAILILIGCQLAGEALARGLTLPIPGPVLGMALLFAALQGRSRLRPAAAAVETLPLGVVSAFLIAHLSLLFVPAGAGIVAHLGTLAQHGVGLIAALVISTLLTLAVTALVFDKVAAMTRAPGDE
ncbi:MAG: CidA/LrgA family protein [Bosea sp.]|jgi:holin-like protein|nr:CidA/LrgA family protein [Bosea sp. (in: a-proteobacteria)]